MLLHTLGTCCNSFKCHRPIKPLSEVRHCTGARTHLLHFALETQMLPPMIPFFAALNGLKLKCSVDCSHLFRHLESSVKKMLRLMTVIFQWNKW